MPFPGGFADIGGFIPPEAMKPAPGAPPTIQGVPRSVTSPAYPALPNGTVPTSVEGPDPYKMTSIPPEDGATGDTSALSGQATQALRGDQAYTDLMNVPVPQGPPQTMGGGHMMAPYGGYPAVKALVGSYNEMGRGQDALAASQAAQAKDEAELRRAEGERQALEAAQEQQFRAQERAAAEAKLKELSEQAEAIAKTKIDQGRIFRSPAGILGAVAASFMSLAGDPYAGIRLINQNIDRDISIQEKDLATKRQGLDVKRGLLSEYLALTKDDQMARAMTGAKMKEVAANKLLEVAARYRSPQVMAQAQTQAGMLKHDATLMYMDALQKSWRDPKMMSEVQKSFYGFDRVDRDPSKQSELYGTPPSSPSSAGAAPPGTGKAAVGEDGAWDISQGGAYSRDDVEGIKSDGVSAGANPVVDIPKVTLDTSGKQAAKFAASPTFKAAEKMAAEADKKFAVAYDDPTTRAVIESAKATYWPQIVKSHQGNYQAAFKEWKAFVGKGVEDSGKIFTAMKEVDQAATIAKRARTKLAAFRSSFKGRENEVWGKLRQLGAEGASAKIDQLQLAFGNNAETARFMKGLMEDMTALKYQGAHALMGTLSKADMESSDRLFSFGGDVQAVDELLQRMSANVQAAQDNAMNSVGNPIAVAIAKSKMSRGNTRPQATPGK